MDLLEALIVLSEKAARIARLIRKDEHLFKLLVEQKDQDEANPRFVDDFKTLADVLIQEMIKHFLERQFPGIAERVRGEENNTFCNKLGDKITVAVKETPQETSELLEKVLDGNQRAATLLAEEVHRAVEIGDVNTRRPESSCQFDVDKLGIWIDPIDSTAEYINGGNDDSSGNRESGLNCVTILIGAYDTENGEAISGVVNQPFHLFDGNSWTGECNWGLCYQSIRLNSLNPLPERSNVIFLSSSENNAVKSDLKKKGYEIKEVPGAGNKLLKVIHGQGDCYILSKGTTFKWDTCGPQAILRSQGGDIVDYLSAVNGQIISVKYPHDVNNKKDSCNDGGLIAFRLPEILNDVLDV